MQKYYWMCHIQRLFLFKQYALLVQRFINVEHNEIFPEIVIYSKPNLKSELTGLLFIVSIQNVGDHGFQKYSLLCISYTATTDLYIKKNFPNF